MVKSEYDYIDIIGGTSETYKTETERLLNQYAHKKEVELAIKLINSMQANKEHLLDLGCSIGSWLKDYQVMGFKNIIGVDISSERIEIASKRGYTETHVCNATKLPFPDDSLSCIISNDVFVHIINDNDKIKVFSEVKRVLKKDGVFIVNVANAKGFGYEDNFTKDYCRFLLSNFIPNSLPDGLVLEQTLCSYSMMPRIFANPRLVKLGVKLVFPLLDIFCNKDNAKVIYYGIRKI